MKLKLVRVAETDHGIFGHLTCDSDPFNCVTLERHDIAIPTGTYGIDMYQSPEHGWVPILLNVPNRYYIEIHEGNFEYNSKGCILVGEHRAEIEGKDAINNSKVTLAKLLAVLKNQKDISITIS